MPVLNQHKQYKLQKIIVKTVDFVQIDNIKDFSLDAPLLSRNYHYFINSLLDHAFCEQ
jgi:hypothetical protein